MKSSNRGNSSSANVVNTVVDKENTESFQASVISNPKQRTKQKYSKDLQEQKDEVPTETMGMDEFKMHKTSDRLSLSEKIELIEQKFSKLQSLKDDTMDELSSLLNEICELLPILNHLNTSNLNEREAEPTLSNLMDTESGLSKLLNRFQQLQQDYQKRRSVSEKRYTYRVNAVEKRHNAEIFLNRNESLSDTAENYVALIHKYKGKGNLSKSSSSSNLSVSSLDQKPDILKNGTSSSVISARKRSLPAINLPATTCPPALKMARRQSVAAYPQAPSNIRSTVVGASILNFNSQNALITPKSAIDADLLIIKSRISKALKR